MRIILINLLKKKIDICTKSKKKYGLRDPSYHILSGKIEAYSEILKLLKEEKNGSTKEI
nr:MAG TPA: hypothetical protein [Caudoviricetes sp.]